MYNLKGSVRPTKVDQGVKVPVLGHRVTPKFWLRSVFQRQRTGSLERWYGATVKNLQNDIHFNVVIR